MTTLEQSRADLEAIVARRAEALAAYEAAGSDRDRDSAILRCELACPRRRKIRSPEKIWNPPPPN